MRSEKSYLSKTRKSGTFFLGGVVFDPKSFVADFFGNFEGGIMNFWEKRDFAPILKIFVARFSIENLQKTRFKNNIRKEK